ncbi:MAG: HyaD/HybD family hydrogenase maturation endopeptidase [Geovibrio sp.]|jgi:hydrogenase maturation protease|uniref:HyaD/HybD family hydrogenase maturation endopeptidase n=1 Tax=Geovibrio ferrireducens TaxID=46201 RepID=UPI002246F7DA|nr:HyaD/HybD family hydrogenase maturation endopeptidase [Geovibrio ferrireducens]MCD8493364.1 HyaD/HybD family hydrogenase maturation endopeptidase [Geovibrio sp.]
MNVLVFGAGNILLGDEGFGVHMIQHMEKNFEASENVELYDGGTMGIFATHKLEEAEHIIIIDTLDTDGEPGEIRTYGLDDIRLNRIPAKMSPHQIGLQEVLLISEVRGKVPESVKLLGIIPKSLEGNLELSPELQDKVAVVEKLLLDELGSHGITLKRKQNG